jgi:hypothetical protein
MEPQLSGYKISREDLLEPDNAAALTRIALEKTRKAFKDGNFNPATYEVDLEQAKLAARWFSDQIGVKIGYEQLVRIVLAESKPTSEE